MKKNDVICVDGKYFNVERHTIDQIETHLIQEGIIRPNSTYRFPSDAIDDESFGLKRMKLFALQVSTENILKVMRTYTDNIILNIRLTDSAENLYSVKDEINILKLYNSNTGNTIFLREFKIQKSVKRIWIGECSKMITSIRISKIKKC